MSEKDKAKKLLKLELKFKKLERKLNHYSKKIQKINSKIWDIKYPDKYDKDWLPF